MTALPYPRADWRPVSANPYAAPVPVHVVYTFLRDQVPVTVCGQKVPATWEWADDRRVSCAACRERIPDGQRDMVAGLRGLVDVFDRGEAGAIDLVALSDLFARISAVIVEGDWWSSVDTGPWFDRAHRILRQYGNGGGL